ncbi:hypothetical protein IGI04_018716 [Brassica rapa subsp. trilocularis]|uniref:Uncharacterized protein n=1 Tax=Brassica rapa subsp. trilocularis TaxID=1813537 RepID=A0ABQ7MDR2_BRACM|nr:hypothetical protein IGI04_018716 [Brassica rapa subsp. trilocularis]
MHNNRENTKAHSPRRRRCLWPPALTLQPPLSLSSNSLCNIVLCFIVCSVAISALCSTHSDIHPLRALLAEKRSSKSSALLITTYNRRDPPTSSSCFVNLRTFDYPSQIEKVKSRSYGSTLNQRDIRLTLLYEYMSFLMVPPLRKALVSKEPPCHASTQHHQYGVLDCLSSPRVAQPVVRSPGLSSQSLHCVSFHHQWSKVQTGNFPLIGSIMFARSPSPFTSHNKPLCPWSPLSPTSKLREPYVHLNSKVVPSTTLCVVLLRQPIHSSLQCHLNSASPDFVNCNLSETVSSTTVCSPSPEASLHLTATSGDPYVFRDGYQQQSKPIGWALGIQMKIFCGLLLSLATSLFRYGLIMLAYQFTVEYLSGYNRFSLLDV